MKVRNLDKEPYKGITAREGKYIATGMPTIDYALNDLAPGCLTLILGRMNCGKTTYVKQIIANAINDHGKAFIINGEGDTEIFINELYKCVIGRRQEFYDVVKINKRYHKEPKKSTLSALADWHKGKLVISSKTDADFESTDELFKTIEHQIKVDRPDLIVIDNLMSVLTAKSDNKNELQSDFIQKCHDIAVLNRNHIVIVLHPNKGYRKGMEMEAEDTSGTSDMANKTDNMIAIIREYDEDKIAAGVNGQIMVLKNKYYSDIKKIDVMYDEDTGLLLEIKDGKGLAYKFNIDNYIELDKECALPFDL